LRFLLALPPVAHQPSSIRHLPACLFLGLCLLLPATALARLGAAFQMPLGNPPPAIFAFTPTMGTAATAVALTGGNFVDVTAVAFNGVSAAFTVDSAQQLTALVPTNAGSGDLSVTTPSGTAISTRPFTVLGGGGVVYRGPLAAWDFSGLPGGLRDYGPSPLAPSTAAPGLAVAGLARGSGVKTTGTAAAGAWGDVGFTSATASAAEAARQFCTFTVTATNRSKVSFTRLSRLDYYRSATGPTSGLLQFQVGSGDFTDLATLDYPVANAGVRALPIPPYRLGSLTRRSACKVCEQTASSISSQSVAAGWFAVSHGRAKFTNVSCSAAQNCVTPLNDCSIPREVPMNSARDAVDRADPFQAARPSQPALPPHPWRDGLPATYETDLTGQRLPPAGVKVRLQMAAQPKFTLGRVCRTLNAVNRLPADEVLKAIARHAVGDWGALNAHDRRANKRSLGRRGRLVSVYQASNGSRFDVITDTGWAATKVLLPGDF
jgi:hypothetical protein